MLAVALVDPEKRLTGPTGAAGKGKGDDSSDDPYCATGHRSSYREPLTASELTQAHFTLHDLKRLELYSRNMVD